MAGRLCAVWLYFLRISACLLARAFSWSSALSIHSLCSWSASSVIGRWSRSVRCYKSWAGLRWMSVSGVFLYCIKAFATLSVSREPVREILFIIIRLAVLTADSARPFDCGYDTDESLCLTPQLVRNCWNECAMNCGPQFDSTTF